MTSTSPIQTLIITLFLIAAAAVVFSVVNKSVTKLVTDTAAAIAGERTER